MNQRRYHYKLYIGGVNLSEEFTLEASAINDEDERATLKAEKLMYEFAKKHHIVKKHGELVKIVKTW